MLDWCTRWPAAPADDPAGPVRPPGGRYPDVPVLVLSGELDSITTPAEGAIVARQFPDAMQAVVPNTFHITALADTDGCASRVVRRFVRHPQAAIDPRVCSWIPAIRAPAIFPRATADLGLRRTAEATVRDVLDRWWNNYSGHGFGLRGGRFSYTGDRVTRFRLHGYRLVRDLPVSGRVVWHRYDEKVVADLRIPGHGRVHLSITLP
jgi:hypothetical protein